MKRHTKQWKEDSLTDLKKLGKKYSVVALADISGFPADLFQKIRKKLKGKAVIKVSKTRLIQKALNETHPVETQFSGLVQNMCAIIFTELNPFELFALVKKNKGSTSAKAGQIAPEDIMIPAGDTGLPPGPALTDLKNAGLKVKLQGPTIQISEDKIVAKKGEVISTPVAAVLSKLNIKPIKVGLTITAVLEKQTLFLPAVLDIDEVQMFENFKKAYMDAFALALEIGYPTPQTVKVLVQKAFRNTKTVALKANIPTEFTIGELAAKAQATAEILKSKIKDA